MKPFSYFKKPTKLPNPTVVNTQQTNREIWIFSINSGRFFFYLQQLHTLFQNRAQPYRSSVHIMSCVLCLLVLLLCLSPYIRPEDLTLKMKIYVKVNINCTDFMERTCGIDASADTNGLKILRWTLAAWQHAWTRELHSTHVYTLTLALVKQLWMVWNNLKCGHTDTPTKVFVTYLSYIYIVVVVQKNRGRQAHRTQTSLNLWSEFAACACLYVIETLNEMVTIQNKTKKGNVFPEAGFCCFLTQFVEKLCNSQRLFLVWGTWEKWALYPDW